MMPRLSQAIMRLAMATFAPHRRDWARAMQTEFECAREEGHGFAFASGCLKAACFDLPRSEFGRLAISRYALALCVLLPLAAILVVGAYYGYPYDDESFAGPRLQAMTGLPLINDGNQFAIFALPTMLCTQMARLILLAWFVAERNWHRVDQIKALGAAMTITFAIACVVVMGDLAGIAIPAIAFAIECIATSHVQTNHMAEGETTAG